MFDAFGKAERVIVFLGEASDSSDLAVEAVRRIAHPISKEQQETFSTYAQAAVKIPLSHEQSRRLFSVEEERALGTFFDKPYFLRLWMLQEVFIAQMLTVMCGHKLVDFSILYFGFLNLYITHYHLFRELFRPVESKDQETKIEYIRKHGAWKMLDCVRVGSPIMRGESINSRLC